MSAPVPRTAYAVRTIIITVVVFEIVSPVIWIFAYSDDRASKLLVIPDSRCHVFWNHDSVLLIPEKVDGRGLGLLYKSLGVRLGLFLLDL